jgi:Uncharacterized protein conserved in bacteria
MKFEKLPFNSIIPKGRLLERLRAQADGLTGHIGEVWYDLSDDSAWLGGMGEAWERGPYYLDGLVPLAYILKDKNLIEKAEKWVNAILSSQKESGFFGPVRSRDPWSRTVALKALVSYHEATGDGRVLPFFKKYFDFQLSGGAPRFFMWAVARSIEELIPINYYIEQTGDKSVLPLVDFVKNNTLDWVNYFKNVPYKESARKYLDRRVINIGRVLGESGDQKKKHGVKPLKESSPASIARLNSSKFMQNLMYTHGVNVAMAIKYPALTGEPEIIREGLKTLLEYHGNAAGALSSDEHLDGNSPDRGIELCSIAEAMYSYEILFEITGDGYYLDKLEFLACNALPAAFTPDMKAHQYVEQVNQLNAARAHHGFFDVGKEGNTFGIAPNFGCCAANMHQAYPKFARSIVYKTGGEGLFFAQYASADISADKIKLDIETDYPYSDKGIIKIIEGSPARLSFRVPEGTALSVSCGGKRYKKSEGIIEIEGDFKAGEEIELDFDMPLREIENSDGSVSYRRGPLLLSYKIPAKEISYGEGPYRDRGYVPQGKWNFAPVFDGKNYTVKYDEKAEIPLEIMLPAREVLNWKERGKNAPLPEKPAFSEKESSVTLAPYGFTVLRMTHFPKL